MVSLALLFPLLLGSRCKEKPDETPDITVPSDLNAPEVQLQVISIEPAQGAAHTPFQAYVYGAEFQVGARVRLGNVPAQKVALVNENTLHITVPAMEMGIFDVNVHNADGEKAVLRRGLSISGLEVGRACRQLTVYFDFDRSDLQAASSSLLAQNSDCLRESRGTVRVEGHSDERGTTEYNLALGERRAHSVQRYLVSQGVSPGRVSTISYGEERPATRGQSESAWQQNRRAEILLQD